MKQGFKRIAPRLYERTYATANGESTLYYARFVCALKGKRRLFALGGDLKKAKNELKIKDAENIQRKDFDKKPEPEAAPVVEQKPQPMTVHEWVPLYLDREETKAKRAYSRIREFTVPLVRHLGNMALIDLTHDDLTGYIAIRKREYVMRHGKPSKTLVKQGTIANELSYLRAMLNCAFLVKDKKIVGTRERQYPKLEGFTVNVSFRGLILRNQRKRVLDPKEEKALLDAYPAWMQRVCIFAVETSLSQGDIIRLTKSMIDYDRNEIVPAGGRLKTGVEQRAPLTERARAVLEEIEVERRAGRIVANVNGLIFTRDDGRAIKPNMIERSVTVALGKTGIKDFRFHDYRHTALTQWATGRSSTGEKIHVDVGMLASGHKSVAMHQRYVNLQPGDVAAAFGLKNRGNTDGRQKEPTKVTA